MHFKISGLAKGNVAVVFYILQYLKEKLININFDYHLYTFPLILKE